MNLTEFFDALIKLQKYGYKIHSIEEDEYKNRFVRFAYAHVCSGLAFGGVQYEMTFGHNSFQPECVVKFVVKQLEFWAEPTEMVSNMDEAVDFIIADIQEIEKEQREGERQRVLAKLTQRERELLGV